MSSAAARDIGIDRGVFLRGTPLWIDAEKKKSHTVLTALAGRLPAKHERLLTTFEGAAMLSRAGMETGVLPATYRQWMGFGGRQLQLVDVGSAAGECGVLVDDGTRRTLVFARLPRDIQGLPPVDHLVLKGCTLGMTAAPIQFEVEKLVRSAMGARQTIRVQTVQVGIEVLGILKAAGVLAHASGLLGKLLGSKGRSRHGWAVRLIGCRSQVEHAISLNTDSSKAAAPHEICATYYGNWESFELAVSMTGATTVSLYDLPQDFTLPASFEKNLDIALHRPLEKSLGLGFAAESQL